MKSIFKTLVTEMTNKETGKVIIDKTLCSFPSEESINNHLEMLLNNYKHSTTYNYNLYYIEPTVIKKTKTETVYKA